MQHTELADLIASTAAAAADRLYIDGQTRETFVVQPFCRLLKGEIIRPAVLGTRLRISVRCASPRRLDSISIVIEVSPADNALEVSVRCGGTDVRPVTYKLNLGAAHASGEVGETARARVRKRAAEIAEAAAEKIAAHGAAKVATMRRAEDDADAEARKAQRLAALRAEYPRAAAVLGHRLAGSDRLTLDTSEHVRIALAALEAHLLGEDLPG